MSNGEEREVGVRSVERAISILDLLAQGGWRTGADVARELHVHRSTALRLLGTLERHALVERDQRTARYRLGRRLPSWRASSLASSTSALPRARSASGSRRRREKPRRSTCWSGGSSCPARRRR